MSDELYGQVLSVDTRNLSEPTTAPAAAGDLSVSVADAGTFDDKGGTISIDGEPYTYASVDVETNTIQLSGVLGVNVPEGALVQVEPPSPMKVALVDTGGEGDPVPMVIPKGLEHRFDEGLQTGEEQTVRYGFTGQATEILDIVEENRRADFMLRDTANDIDYSLNDYMSYLQQLGDLEYWRNPTTQIATTTAANLWTGSFPIGYGGRYGISEWDQQLDQFGGRAILEVNVHLDVSVNVAGVHGASTAFIVQLWTNGTAETEQIVWNEGRQNSRIALDKTWTILGETSGPTLELKIVQQAGAAAGQYRVLTPHSTVKVKSVLHRLSV
jgi:hypothetical protein